MGPFEMVVVIVFIGCLSGVLTKYLESGRRWHGSETAVQDALRQMRAEMAELRKSTNDVVLSFESTVQRLDARVQHLEQTALGGASGPSAISAGSVSAPASQPVQQTEMVGGAR